ncbi:hypothetical protein CAPTEDRAFT_194036 [Capitella teleta]|uniref:Uncharacterized protein n=1 Tax=Capitella teleta TaxID=283909 RepID=R7UVA4_CAPTE|nr:hypothetical protein CAPTEDRAFT_194036 [Capitella teleta]|eukprot:ELU10568.1 hypothetical protein CAPTEDRAFT_194036 [Capitella teleta]
MQTDVPERSPHVQVLLLSYQRSGSTMMGNVLFQHHENASSFFWYEPLDALYTALYGTEPGWNIPADITFFPNGSYRSPPAKESSSVEKFLLNVFQCKFNRLPTEALVHPFWFYFPNTSSPMHSYPRCLNAHGVTSASLYSCQVNLRRSCGRRFSVKQARSATCLKRMQGYNTSTLSPMSDRIPINFARRHGWELIGRRSGIATSGTNVLFRLSPFLDYKTCLRLLAQRSLPCQPVLSNLCEERPVTAIKTVRATMSSVRTLLHDLPNLKVIHLLRDPRGAILSRSKVTWSQGAFDAKNVSKMAAVYCGTIMQDIRTRLELTAIFPGRLMQVVFEEFLENPHGINRKMLNFIAADHLFDGSKMAQWVDQHIKSSVKEKWIKALGENDAAAIARNCGEYMSHIKSQ